MFIDRKDAGKQLAEKLRFYANPADVIVLGLPRGGVPVAFEVAAALNVPLDVFIVRKIGVPGHPELAMGAIASGGSCYLNERLIDQLDVSKERIQAVIDAEKKELERRERLYRAGRRAFDLKYHRVILVDDGLATGASMLAAIQAVREHSPKELIVAVPVVAASSIPAIESEVDGFVYVLAPHEFYSVGQWYEDFGQTTDEEVKSALVEANHLSLSLAQMRSKN